ncbi:protein takeout-like [Haematobia irritans]|uniref:protein takeout-like n=1 Tax=Haematobia irritans TaxID=7368 RepID=UPI003F5060D9
MKSQIILLLVTLSWGIFAEAEKILNEKPNFLNPCSVKESSFKNCFIKNMDNILKEWKTGIPGLDSIKSLDPLDIKHIEIDGDPQSPMGINLKLDDVVLSGISAAKCSEASFSISPLGMSAVFDLSKINMKGEYNISGHILDMPLDGQGQVLITVDKLVAELKIRFLKRQDKGHLFTDVERLRMNLHEVTGLQMKFDNLFNGNTTASNAAHKVLNEKSSSIFQVFRPSINAAMGRLMKDYWGKMFTVVPATYFFADLPNVKTRSG